MELFEIYKDLIRETFMLKAFKSMGIVKAILCALALAPFIVAYAVIMLLYGFVLILYRIISDPFTYLYDFVKTEGKDVKHATQAVIYFIAFPLIFFIRLVLCIMTFELIVIHFIASVLGYFATYGGIKFSPFMITPVDRTAYKIATNHNQCALIIFVSVALALISFSYLLMPIARGVDNILPQYTLSEQLHKRVEIAYRGNEISPDQYNDFISDYDKGLVTDSNCRMYARALGLQDFETTSFSLERMFQPISLATEKLYYVFVMVWIPVYYEILKRLKKAQHVECDACQQ